MNKERVKTIFNRFSQLKALVIGDVMLDCYVNGSVSRISPEAPVPVVLHQSTEYRLGGAANVALNIRALGATPVLCSVIGADDEGKKLLSMLPEAGISIQGMYTSPERRTTVKTRILAGNHQMLRIDQEDTLPLEKSEYESFLAMLKSILEEGGIDVIIFQDYNKGVLHPNVIETVMEWALKLDIPTTVDPKKENFFGFHGVTLFKPNLKEIREGLNTRVQAEVRSLKAASDLLRSRLHNKISLITLSEKGIFVDDGQEHALIPTKPRQVNDVCGAGDTVISVASLALAAGLSPKDMAQLSNLAGGLVCERVGVVPVDKSSLLQEYLQLSE